MLYSLRSPLIAGTVAAVGAAGLAALPADQGRVMAALATPQVALAAFVNPVTELLATAGVAQNYLLGVYYNGGDSPTPGAGEANWPYAGFDQTGGDQLNYLLYNQRALGYYSFVGLVPNSTNDASPVLRALQTNWADYLNVGLSGVIAAASAISEGVWDFPGALLNAAQLALQGQITEALNVLTAAVLGPVVAAGDALMSAGNYVLTTALARIGALAAALPQIVTTFAGAVVGGAAVLAEKSVAIVTEWVGRLAALDIEGAWNVAVAGLLGPAGLPGTTLNLTIGPGVQTGPIINPATDIAGNFVPSVRTAVQAAVWTVEGALCGCAAAGAAVPAAQAAVEEPAAVPPAAAVPGSAGAADPIPESSSADDAAGPGPKKAGLRDRAAARGERAQRSDAKRAGG